MYEDGNKKLSLNWSSLAIKLVILAVIVFLAGWIFVKVTGKSSTSSNNTLADSNSEYIDNINAMKTAAFEYFTQSKLPEKIGGTEKLTLAQMINQKLLIDFTNDGKTCDTNSSYIQTTKTADGNYALKVSLTCGKQSDFIVTTIEKSACESNGTCTSGTKTNTDVVDNSSKNKTTTNNNSNKNSTTNNGSSNNNNKSNSTSNTGTASKPSSSNSSTSTTTKTTVSTTISIKVNCTSNCCSNNCNNNDNKKDEPTPTPAPTPTPTPTPTPAKVRYYQYVKWSDWSDGYSYEKEAQNKSQEIVTHNYCKVDTKTIYSTSWVGASSKATSYSYELQMLTLPENIQDLRIDRNSISYFKNNVLTDYQAYLDNKYGVYQTGNDFKWDIIPRNATSFRASALNNGNFYFTVQDAYTSGGVYRTKISINYYNSNGAVAYQSEKGSVFFVPLKFNVTYTDLNNCVKDTEANSSKYPGYNKLNKKIETKWLHRTPDYKWSKETSLEGYEYTGKYEDRAE